MKTFTDTELIDLIEKTKPTIMAIAEPFDGIGDPKFSHWEVNFGLHSVEGADLRKTLNEAFN